MIPPKFLHAFIKATTKFPADHRGQALAYTSRKCYLKNMVGKYLQKTVRTEPEAAFPYRSQWACAIYPQTNWQKKVTIKTYWSRNHFLLRRRKRQSRQS